MYIKSDIRKALIAVAAMGACLPAFAAAPTTPTTRGYPTGTSSQAGVSDDTITAQVQSKLSSMSTLNDADINASTSDGVVTLSGSVQSADEKSQAEAAAKSVKGVKSVDNQLSTSTTSSSSGGGK
jgi:hyperosmotically inducible protein